MKLGWILFTLCIALPGVAEVYAAIKLFPYIRKSGGTLPFVFCLSSGLFDVFFSLIMAAILILDLPLRLNVDTSNPLVLGTVVMIVTEFLSWRISSALIALWFAGALPVEKLKRVLPALSLLKRRRDDV